MKYEDDILLSLICTENEPATSFEDNTMSGFFNKATENNVMSDFSNKVFGQIYEEKTK
ncbi:MAG: hypothetical protein Q4F06_08980 [Eubacteriales bacterium]|nr:hypothetical protein [Eubacteriales bacterium]